MQIYDLKLSKHDLEIIVSALGELPVKVAINTVNNLLNQKSAQDMEMGKQVSSGDSAGA